MSFDAGSITGSLDLDTSGFTHGILDAQSVARVFPSVVIDFITNPLFAAIDVAKATGEAVRGMFEGMVNDAGQLHNMAQAAGVTVEWLDAMGKAAVPTGGNVGMVADMARFLSRNMGEAAAGGKDAIAVFQKIGVSATDSSGQLRPMQQVMEEVIDRMAAMPDGAGKAAVALQLFGRGGTESIAFINQGMSRIREFTDAIASVGGITTTSQADSAHAWEEAEAKITGAWSGIRNQLAQPVVDALTPYLNGLMAWMQQHPGEIKAEVHAVAADIVAAATTGGNIIVRLVTHLDDLVHILGPAVLGVAGGFAVKQIAEITAGLAAMATQAAAAAAEGSAAANSMSAGKAGAGVGLGLAAGSATGDGGKGSMVGGAAGGLAGMIAGDLLGGPIAGYLASMAVGALGSWIGGQVMPAAQPTLPSASLSSPTASPVGAVSTPATSSPTSSLYSPPAADSPASATNAAAASAISAGGIIAVQLNTRAMDQLTAMLGALLGDSLVGGGSVDATPATPGVAIGGDVAAAIANAVSATTDLTTATGKQTDATTSLTTAAQSIADLLAPISTGIDRLTSSLVPQPAAASPVVAGNNSTSITTGPVNVSYGSADATSQLAKQLLPQIDATVATQRRNADAQTQLARVRASQGAY